MEHKYLRFRSEYISSGRRLSWAVDAIIKGYIRYILANLKIKFHFEFRHSAGQKEKRETDI